MRAFALVCIHCSLKDDVNMKDSLSFPVEVLLSRPGTRQQLAPRLPAPERVGFIFSRFPRFCSGGFIAWAINVWRRRRERADLQPDAQILVRFCELGLKFSLLGTALSLILLPMYATGPGRAVGFNVLCLANLKVGGSIRFLVRYHCCISVNLCLRFISSSRSGASSPSSAAATLPVRPRATADPWLRKVAGP